MPASPLGTIALIVAAVRGPSIPPEGDLMKPATFDIAVGLFVLSLVPWLPMSGFSDAARRRWRLWMVGLLIYARDRNHPAVPRGRSPLLPSRARKSGQLA